MLSDRQPYCDTLYQISVLKLCLLIGSEENAGLFLWERRPRRELCMHILASTGSDEEGLCRCILELDQFPTPADLAEVVDEQVAGIWLLQLNDASRLCWALDCPNKRNCSLSSR